MRPAKRCLTWLIVAVVYLAAWQIAAMLVGSELLLPAPLATLRRFITLLGQADSWLRAGMSLLRIVAGYAGGVLAGVLLAILTARFRFADALLLPLRSIVKATPVTSFILLALLWLRSGVVPAFISFLMVLPLVWTNVLTSIRETDKNLLEMARAYHFSRRQRLFHVYAPSVLPGFLASCTTALGFAWKAGVAAEILALPQLSIGYALYMSKLHIETLDLFAWTLLIVILSMLLEAVLTRLIRRIPHDYGA